MRAMTMFGWCAGLTLGLAALAAPQTAQAWCYVDLDKCVLVDHDGDGFDDETCVDPAEAMEGDMVKWQYTVSNTSDWHWDLHYCVLDDPQAQFYYEIPGSIESPTMANGGPTSVTFTTDATQCVDLYNVAEVACDCYESGVNPADVQWPANHVSDTDDATLTCIPVEEPGLDVDKECYPQSEGYNDVKITIENTGDVDFIDCEVTDPLAAACEGLTGPIAAHTSKEVTCSVGGLKEDVYNKVSVTCGTGTERLTATAKDLCEVKEPNFQVWKDCGEQYLFNRSLVNDFTVTAQNTGASDLYCRITADALNRGGGYAEIPQCENGHDGICWECDRTMGALPVGATVEADCRVYNLPEPGLRNQVEVQCTDGYHRITRYGEDFCEVPRDFDFRVRKVCAPQYIEDDFDSLDGGLRVNRFEVFVKGTEGDELECAVTGDALSLDGKTFRDIQECDFSNGDASVASTDGRGPCFLCMEPTNGEAPAVAEVDYDFYRQCVLVGLPQSAYDRVEVTCTDGYTRKTHTGQDWCAVPGLKVEKECEPYEDGNGEPRVAVVPNGEPTHTVEIEVTNTSDIPLTNCRVQDQLDVVCPANSNGTCPYVECDIEPFGLRAQGSASFECQVYGAYEEVLNYVHVACEYDGHVIKARDKDWCEVEKNDICIDRSPGYWVTHPEVRQYVIDSDSPTFCGGNDFFGALCDSGSLEFHCAAAALDLAATDIFDGTCEDGRRDNLEAAFAACCTGTGGVCDGGNSCKDRIDALYDRYEIEFCEDLPGYDGACSAAGNQCPRGNDRVLALPKPRLFTPDRPEPQMREAPEQLQRKIEMLRERLENRDLRVE